MIDMTEAIDTAKKVIDTYETGTRHTLFKDYDRTLALAVRALAMRLDELEEKHMDLEEEYRNLVEAMYDK